jgi:hypothetical protein
LLELHLRFFKPAHAAQDYAEIAVGARALWIEF